MNFIMSFVIDVNIFGITWINETDGSPGIYIHLDCLCDTNGAMCKR